MSKSGELICHPFKFSTTWSLWLDNSAEISIWIINSHLHCVEYLIVNCNTTKVLDFNKDLKKKMKDTHIVAKLWRLISFYFLFDLWLTFFIHRFFLDSHFINDLFFNFLFHIIFIYFQGFKFVSSLIVIVPSLLSNKTTDSFWNWKSCGSISTFGIKFGLIWGSCWVWL